jgi:hypothetical protein
METKYLVQKFRTILLNDFYENRGKLLDNMKIIRNEDTRNEYENIFIKNIFDYILGLEIENETKIKKQSMIQSKFLQKIKKDETMKEVFDDLLDSINEI